MLSAYNFCLCTPNACYNGHFYLINEPKATAAAEDAPGLVEFKAKSRGLLCLRAGNSSAKQLSAIRLITISSSSSSSSHNPSHSISPWIPNNRVIIIGCSIFIMVEIQKPHSALKRPSLKRETVVVNNSAPTIKKVTLVPKDEVRNGCITSHKEPPYPRQNSS